MNLRDLFENSAHTGSHREVNARLQRILRRLQMANPQARDDLEAILLHIDKLDQEQYQDRRDIGRLDNELDTTENIVTRILADIDRLRQRGAITQEQIGIRGLGESNKKSKKKDACYHKVKSRYKVWPSAYASGALVQCRKRGAKNWGEKS